MQAKHQRRRAPKHRRTLSPGMLQNGGIRVLLSCIVAVSVAGALTLPGISASKQDLENAGVALSASVASEQEEGSQEDAPDAASTDKSAGEKTADKADSDPEPSSTPTKDAANAEDADAAAETPAADADASDTDADAMPAQSFSGELKNKKDEVVLSVEVESPEGALPAGTTMELEAVKAKDVKDAVGDAVAEKTDAKVDSLQAVDITFKDADGNEVEPAAKISVKFAAPKIANKKTDTLVVHIDDEGEAAVVDQLAKKDLEQRDQKLEDDELMVDVDEFSVYVLAYTVDFAYSLDGETYEYSIPGGGFVSLRNLVDALGIATDNASANQNDTQKFIDDIESVESSAPELVSVSKVEEETTVGEIKERLNLDCEYSSDLTDDDIEQINSQVVEAGDWALISLQPFTSEETLTVTMATGDVWTIRMTDEQLSKTVITAKGEAYKVKVTYGSDAGIPQGAELRVQEFAEDSQDYQDARKTVIESEYLNAQDDAAEGVPSNMSADTVDDIAAGIHFQAFDVKIVDEDGAEIEPQAPVQVSFELIQAVSEEEKEQILGTIEVHHLLDQEGAPVTQNVVSTDAADPKGDVSVSQDSIQVGFMTESFSTYTINWNTDRGRITVNFRYVDEDGNAVNGRTGQESIHHTGGDRNYAMANYAPEVDGYAFVGAKYNDASFTMLRLTANTNWYYDNGWTYNNNYYNRVFFLNDNNVPVATESIPLNTNQTVNVQLVYEKKKPRKVHYGYIENGQFVEWSNELIEDIGTPDFVGDQFNACKDFEGKDYVTTRLNDPVNGTQISPLLQTEKESAAYWRYRILNTPSVNGGINEWQIFGRDDNDLYVIYRDTPTEKSYSTDIVKPEDLEAPAATKEFESNHDGTYDLVLGVTGKSNQAIQKTHANVVIVMDTSSSMDYTYSENPQTELGYSRLSAAKEAVCDLADQLFALNSNDDPAAIELAFVNFSHRVRNEQTMQTIYNGTNSQSFKDMVNATNGNGGTNYDTAIEAANSILWNDADPTYVVFVTDGDTVSRGYLKYGEGDGSDHASDWDGGTYYNGDVETYGNSYLERARSAAAIQVNKVLDSGKKFYSIGVFGNVAYLEDMGGTYLGQANDKDAINAAFSKIISEIEMDLGYQDVVINDGLTALTSTTLEHGAAGNFTYYRSGGTTEGGTEKYDSTANNGRGETWNLSGSAQEAFFLEIKDANTFYKNGSEWTDITDEQKTAYIEKYGVGSRTVVWDLGSDMLEDGVTYKVAFTVWPCQDAYDLVANLNNGTVKFDELDDSVKAQIVESGGVYYVKTNTTATVDYTSVRTENDQVTETKTGSATIKDPEGKMNLDTNQMTVKKEFAHLINEADPYEEIVFYLLVDGKYYNKDGSLSDTLDEGKVYAINLPKDNKWEDEIYIAPGLMRGNQILETGHNYSLVEKIVSGNPYEYEFAPQTVRPMVITAVPTFLVKKDAFNTNTDSKQEYTFNDTDGTYVEVTGKSDAENTYYVASENNGSLVGVNHKTSELDITKTINDPKNFLTPAQEATETFTYRVTLQVPDGADPSGIVGYEYVPRTQENAFTLFGYQTGQSAFPEDIERFNGKTYRAWNTLVYDALIEYDRVTENGRTVIKPRRDADGNIIWKVPAVDGYHTIKYDMTLKQDEVIRFTNLPTGTKYTIQEIYANKYPADNVGGKTDGRTPVEDESNLSAEDYEVERVQHTGGTLSEDNTTVSGTIDQPDNRYYNQFTNKKVKKDSTTRAELKVKKSVKGYTWDKEYYRFTLAAGDATYTDADGGSGKSPMPDGIADSVVSVYKTTADQTLSFGKIRYTRPGTYKYTVSEANNSQNMPHVLFAAPVTLTVTVSADDDGTLYVEKIEDNKGTTTFTAGTDEAIAVGTTTQTNTSKKIQLKKVDKNTPNKVLSDAVFEIYSGPEKQYLQGGTLLNAGAVKEIIGMDVSADGAEAAMEAKGIQSSFTLGQVEVSGFTYNNAVYELREVTAPAGYVFAEGSVYFKVVFDGTDTYLRLTDKSGVVLTGEDNEPILDNDQATVDANSLSISIKNEPGKPLPNTGGPGTAPLYLLGALLVALASAFLLRRRTA